MSARSKGRLKPPSLGTRQAAADREGLDSGDRHDFHGGIGQKAFIGFAKVCQPVMAFFDEQPLFLCQGHHDRSSDAVQDAALQPGGSPFDLVKAVFPGGTITGVPKLRCMEIIEELEPVRRGLYTGALGYFSWNGDLDLNILIRTLVLTHHQGYLQVGAGIVADSDPDREYDETLAKAGAFFKILEAGG